jgi:peptide/nickel transport system permease protein
MGRTDAPMSRAKYFVRRTVITIALIYLVASALFIFFRLMPGSYADLLLQQGLSTDQIATLERKWGLNQPLYIQYINYIQNLLTADVGQSFVYGEDVWTLVRPRMINSFILIGPAITTSYLIGALVGSLMGSNRGALLEKYGIIAVSAFKTIPEFFGGIILLTIFASTFNVFPSAGMLSTETSRALSSEPFYAMFATVDFWQHYVLPFTTVMLYFLTLPALIMRTNVVEVLGQDFLYYHRITGLDKSLRLKKLIKHASLPVITLYPVSMTRAIGGMVLVEVVFNWPGIGSLLVESVLSRDYPVVQFVFLVAAIWVIVGNYAVDVLYSVIDPRVTIEGQEE